MSEKDTDLVLAELLVIVEQLLGVIRVCAARTLRQVTVVGTGSIVIHERTVGIHVTAVIVVGTCVEREGKAVHQLKIGKAAHRKGIAVGTGGLILVTEDAVAAGAARTVETIGLGEVITRLSPAVDHNVAVAVAKPHGVNRGLRLDGLPDEAGIQGAFRRVVIFIFRIVEIAADLEPGLSLVIRGKACRQTVLVGTFLDTGLVQITDRGEIVDLTGDRTGHGNVILLTEAVLQALFLPVVRLQPESLTVIDVEGAEAGLGVHRAPLKDKVFPAGNRVDHVARTRAGTLNIAVGLGMGICFRSAVQYGLIINGLIISLIELLRIHRVVQLQGICVHTPLGVEGHFGVTGLAALCRDHDDAVCTTGTVKSVGSSILEDGHRLDIRRVDEVQVTVIRHTVHDDQRRSVGRIRTNTADGDGR